MKKVYFIISAWLVLAFAWGCGAAPAVVDITPAPVSSPAPTPFIILEPTPSPTPVPDALTAGDGVYTIAWISDTQHYSDEYPDVYLLMTDFLARERERLNLQYVVHTGDLVHQYDDDGEWETAKQAQATLAGVPNGLLAGNHDVAGSKVRYDKFQKHFGRDMRNNPWCGGVYEEGRGHYDLIDAGQTRYLFVYMGYAPDFGCVRWARETFEAYPDRVGILCLHDYFKTDLSLSDSGKTMLKKVVEPNPNVYMVLCGHRYNAACVPLELEGRRIYQLMCNYQAAGDRGGDGYMRFFQVDEGMGEIRVFSYSPLTKDYVYYDTAEHAGEKYAADPQGEQFVLPIPWQ